MYVSDRKPRRANTLIHGHIVHLFVILMLKYSASMRDPQ